MEQELLISKGDTPTELLDKVRAMISMYGQVKVVISPLYETRTKEQNSLYQLYVKRIAKQSGLSDNPNGEAWLRASLKQRAVELGYPAEVDQNGAIAKVKVNYMGKDYEFIKGVSSTVVSIAEFKKLFQACEELAQENGYVLQDTQD